MSFNDFLNKNAVIRYKYNNSVYNQKISNITPSNYNGKEAYFAVSENLKNASEISLVINVRNTEYVYKLK